MQDKHYEIDLTYEKERDLFEKQRVVDNFLQEHQADNQILNSYYQKFNYFAFINTYDPKDLRFHFYTSIGITGIAAIALSMVHPALSLLLAYDVYHLLGYTKVLNQTTFVLALDQGKRHIYLNRLNFLGFNKAFEEKKFSLRTVRFIGEYTNEFINLDNKGLLPSISRMINFGGKKEISRTSRI